MDSSSTWNYFEKADEDDFMYLILFTEVCQHITWHTRVSTYHRFLLHHATRFCMGTIRQEQSLCSGSVKVLFGEEEEREMIVGG